MNSHLFGPRHCPTAQWNNQEQSKPAEQPKRAYYQNHQKRDSAPTVTSGIQAAIQDLTESSFAFWT